MFIKGSISIVVDDNVSIIIQQDAHSTTQSLDNPKFGQLKIIAGYGGNDIFTS